MSATLEIHRVEPGDIVHTSGRHVGDPGRAGEIVGVLGGAGHVRYLVRWEDGHESILYPEGTTITAHDPETGWAD